MVKCKIFFKINSLQPTSAQKKVIIIGSAETRTSILQPTRGMIRYAIRTSNAEPSAHIGCTSNRTSVVILK